MKLSKTYDNIAKEYSKRTYKSFWHNEFAAFKKILKGKRVIDIGCGAGRDAEMFMKNKFDYLGIDFSKGMLREAKKRVPKARFKQMDIYNLDFLKDSFDGFWASASLLHIPKNRLPKVLRSIRAIIKENGIGFISLKEKSGIDHSRVRDKWYGKTIYRYFAYWKKDEMKRVLQKNGFKVIRITKRKSLRAPGLNWVCFFVKKTSSSVIAR